MKDVYKQVIDIEVILEFLTYRITIRYIPRVVALVVFTIRTISYICDNMMSKR